MTTTLFSSFHVRNEWLVIHVFQSIHLRNIEFYQRILSNLSDQTITFYFFWVQRMYSTIPHHYFIKTKAYFDILQFPEDIKANIKVRRHQIIRLFYCSLKNNVKSVEKTLCRFKSTEQKSKILLLCYCHIKIKNN